MSLAKRILEHQLAHVVWLLLLLLGLAFASRLQSFWDGQFLGLSTRAWLILTVSNSLIHQVFVLQCWRMELYSQSLTKYFGSAAFPVYATVFTVLILARPVLITSLAISNSGTLPINPVFAALLSIVLSIPVIYLLYSVRKYFGYVRAFGIDHFDPSYRTLPMVREGIFRFSSNAMYVFGFLLLWIPGLALQSVAATVVAAFSHLYIWVHYFFTEKPNMKYIYGSTPAGDAI